MTGFSLFDRVIGLPEGEGLRGAARRVLCALAYFADRGIKNPSQEWLAGWADITRRRVVDVLTGLESAGWISRTESRSAYGRIQRTIYTILEARLVGRAPWAVELERLEAEIGPSEIKPRNLRAISPDCCEKTATGSSKISHGDVYKERARVYARPSLSILPGFESWNWPSEEVRDRARQVLNVCGPGLADVEEDPAGIADLFHSLATVLSGTWAQFDFQRIVLIVVARKTAKPRPKHKGLRSFYLLTENMIQEQDTVAARDRAMLERNQSRLGHTSRRATASSAIVTDAPERSSIAKQIDLLRRAVARMESGEFGPYDIPALERSAFYASQDERIEACGRALATNRIELARLEMAAQCGINSAEGNNA